jgi:hypothetical protein
MRAEIVDTVKGLCLSHNLNYREFWKSLYIAYGKEYNIWPHIDYQFGSKSKLDFLEEYEELYSTLTKMYNLTEKLK